jgi:phosphopantetheine--protein transferase-like protein
MMEIGTDIVLVSRVSLKDSFLKGVLSPNELKIYEGRPDKAEFVAGRFAAKEAFLKALGTGLPGPRMNLLDIVYEKTGKPVLVYENKKYSVSISHDGGYAIGVALIP